MKTKTAVKDKNDKVVKTDFNDLYENTYYNKLEEKLRDIHRNGLYKSPIRYQSVVEVNDTLLDTEDKKDDLKSVISLYGFFDDLFTNENVRQMKEGTTYEIPIQVAERLEEFVERVSQVDSSKFYLPRRSKEALFFIKSLFF